MVFNLIFHLAHKAFILVFNEKLGEIHAIKLILQVQGLIATGVQAYL
jgi:hypothetical protein